MESGPAQIEALRGNWIQFLVYFGAIVFLVALAVSAFFVPQIRVLHFFQALIYVAIIILTKRNSPWGYGAGVLIGLFWNGFNLFVTHLFYAGAHQLLQLIRDGHVTRPDTFMVFVGGIGHLILILGCIVAFLKSRPTKTNWLQFFGGGLLAVAYLILIVVLVAPR